MLDAIVSSVRARLGTVVSRMDELRDEAERAGPVRGFAGALRASGLSVIAEVKRRSPSRGPISEDLDPAALAAEYQAGGAAAVSVLTEPDYFGGSVADLVAVRRAVAVPVLRKDFLVHPAQIWESRALGADAVLLIVAALDDDELAGMLTTAAEAGVDALVEVHSDSEVDRASRAGAGIVGVNNRDLATFDVDLATAERLRGRLSTGVVAVAESGVLDVESATRMARAGYDAVLVGEAAVRAADRRGFVRSLREAG